MLATTSKHIALCNAYWVYITQLSKICRLQTWFVINCTIYQFLMQMISFLINYCCIWGQFSDALPCQCWRMFWLSVSPQICQIENISCLSRLRLLNLSGNRITRVENLQGLNSLTELNLRHNSITSVVRNTHTCTCTHTCTLESV